MLVPRDDAQVPAMGAAEAAGVPTGAARLAVLAEKTRYPFKNYRHARARSVLFPGCNLPSLFPRTTKALVDVLQAAGEVGVAYDCCGKPLIEAGKPAAADRIIERIGARLADAGAQEVVCTCPNCFYLLRGRLPQRVVSVYDKLAELGEGRQISAEPGAGLAVFPACPDRGCWDMLSSLRPFLPDGTRVIGGDEGAVPCCRVCTPQEVRSFDGALVYCATCAGVLTRAGCQGVRYALSEVLGVDERPDSERSLLNRMKTRFA